MFGVYAFATPYFADAFNGTPTPPVGDTAQDDVLILGQKNSIDVTSDPKLGGSQAW